MKQNKVLIGLAVLLAAGLCWEFCYSLDGFAGIFFGDLFPTDDSTEYASGYCDSGFRKLRKGMTMDEVQSLLGPPLETYEFHIQPSGKHALVVKDGKPLGVRSFHPPEQLSTKDTPVKTWRYSRTPNDGSFRMRNVSFQEGKIISIFSEFYVD